VAQDEVQQASDALGDLTTHLREGAAETRKLFTEFRAVASVAAQFRGEFGGALGGAVRSATTVLGAGGSREAALVSGLQALSTTLPQLGSTLGALLGPLGSIAGGIAGGAAGAAFGAFGAASERERGIEASAAAAVSTRLSALQRSGVTVDPAAQEAALQRAFLAALRQADLEQGVRRQAEGLAARVRARGGR
jgi:hypothetical protein